VGYALRRSPNVYVGSWHEAADWTMPSRTMTEAQFELLLAANREQYEELQAIHHALSPHSPDDGLISATVTPIQI
jgi:hypothetical protein